MGVPGLIALLRKKAPDAFVRAELKDLYGKTVGIDLSITLYRGAATSYRNGAFSHLETMVREIGWLLGLGCKPVYVIDGDSPSEKAEEAQRRESARRITDQRLETLLLELKKNQGDLRLQETAQKLQRQSFRVTSQMRADAKTLLDAMGIPSVQAPGEAERCLAHMCQSRVVEIAFTEDVDVLVCGAPSYLKNSASLMYETESGSSIEGRVFAEHVDLKKVLEGLEISYAGFVAMAVFAGCDFAPKISRFGPTTAWKHVRQCCEDLDVCFDVLKAEDQVLRERYKRAAALLTYDKDEICPVPPPQQRPSFVALEELYVRLRSEGSLTVLRCYVDKCFPHQVENVDDRPTKRLRSCDSS